MEERLIFLRKSINKTQTEIANYLNMQQGSYQKYEVGKAEPNIQTLIKLADYYHVTLDYLVGREFANDAGYLTEREKELLRVYRNLTERNQQTLIDESKGILLAQTL